MDQKGILIQLLKINQPVSILQRYLFCQWSPRSKNRRLEGNPNIIDKVFLKKRRVEMAAAEECTGTLPTALEGIKDGLGRLSDKLQLSVDGVTPQFIWFRSHHQPESVRTQTAADKVARGIVGDPPTN